jgi:phage baseplate assembly protein W
MATFVGYNTIDQYKNYTLVDFDLIKRDLLNALSIKQGEVVGRPLVGTTIWNLIFDSQTPETAKLVREEIQRVIAQDPRIFLNQTTVFTQENGLLIEVLVQTVGSTTAEQLSLFFDQATRRASYV